ncbi:MAG TPA: hypothetical protein PKH69_06685 [Thiobacillaceae bacterium]|nr:hypothetical protein [Thiobacillaceae bacterium]HNU63823.1 hypothetical protein [Thiobacillaceae bacterium]
MSFLDKLRSRSRDWNKTIAVVEPVSRLRNIGVATPAVERVPAQESGEVHQDRFKIRLAHNLARVAEARFLVERRYQQKGYLPQQAGSDGLSGCPDSVTLATYKGEEMMGTLTLGFDVGEGLLADALYKPELDALRASGRRVCEFTKLAIDNKRTSKRMLAGLFHIAYLYAERIWGYTDIIIEVNPSHVSFYERLLGFQVIGPERICSRVNAPAVLLRADTAWGRDMVRKFGGQPELAKSERSLFPYFLSLEEEGKILSRLMQA